MSLLRTYQPKSLVAVISLLLWLSFIASAFAAEHLEIRIRLNTTWKSQTQTNEQDTIALCVLGTNDWYISGQFLKNANVEYWLIGTNVLERKVITSSMYGASEGLHFGEDWHEASADSDCPVSNERRIFYADKLVARTFRLRGRAGGMACILFRKLLTHARPGDSPANWSLYWRSRIHRQDRPFGKSIWPFAAKIRGSVFYRGQFSV